MRIVEIEERPFYEMAYRTSASGRATKTNTLPFYYAYVDKLPSGFTSIAVSSDLQGREMNGETNRLMGIALAEEISLMQELNMLPLIDVMILAGDLYDSPELNKLGATGDVTDVWNGFAEKIPFVIGVLGNHDKITHSKLAGNTLLMDGACSREYGLSVGGVCGIIGRSDKNQRKSEDEYLKALSATLRRNNELIILHQSPRGTEVGQIGEDSIHNALLKYGDSLVITGHVGWVNPACNIGKNQILNTDGKVFILIEKRKAP